MREAAYALGGVAVAGSAASSAALRPGGIATGAIIGLSRAAGETAPLVTISALTFIAFLPPVPLRAEPPFVSLRWLLVGLYVTPHPDV